MIKRIKMRNIFIVCILGVFTGSLFANPKDQEKFVNVLAKSAISGYCKEEKFLNAVKLDKDSCTRLLKRHSEECNQIVKPLTPNVTVVKNEELLNEISISIGYLYAMCLKSKVYEDVFNVPSL